VGERAWRAIRTRRPLPTTAHGQTKTVDAVDGGTDGQAAYWIVTGYLAEAPGTAGDLFGFAS
jgi:hypothetical protein